MKAIVLDGFGDVDVMRVGEEETPEPGENQVRIRVVATSVNRADLVQRQGNYPPPPGASEILGLEAAGVVDKTGPGLQSGSWQPGDRVMTLLTGGGYAEYVVAPAEHLIPIPGSMPFEQAACISEVYITAFLNVFSIAGFQAGETVLLHGGGGGVNTAGIQLCRTLVAGGRILVTASSGKVERVEALGAHRVIDYQREDFSREVRTFTRDRGADVILDHIGAGYLAANLEALAIGGRLVIIGLMGGATAELNLGRLMVKRQRIIGSVLRARPVDEKAVIVAAFRKEVMPHVASGAIAPIIHRVFPLEQAADAHREMAASRHFGKIVLQVQAA